MGLEERCILFLLHRKEIEITTKVLTSLFVVSVLNFRITLTFKMQPLMKELASRIQNIEIVNNA